MKELSPQGMLGILVLDNVGNTASAATEEETNYVMDASMEEPQELKCLAL